jgi:mono/diheme cytochrome c family protein
MSTLAALLAFTAAGCRQDMHDQPRFEPLERSSFFDDRRAGRMQVAGTVARGELNEDAHLHTGFAGGDFATTFPFAMTREDLARGRERFDIMCSPCHGRVGHGDGMVVQRGFRAPPSYHSERMRGMPPGHFFDVMTNGFGAMGDFSDRLSVEDRWRVAAYIQALQLSQAAAVADLPGEVKSEFEQAVGAAR